LKDKIAKSLPVGVLTTTGQDNTLRYEALSALVALGFARNQASKVVDKVIKQDPKNDDLEWLVKQSLRELSN
jgi:Holliday junction DNA helicase RuvA